jgi:hypothetical protein
MLHVVLLLVVVVLLALVLLFFVVVVFVVVLLVLLFVMVMLLALVLLFVVVVVSVVVFVVRLFVVVMLLKLLGEELIPKLLLIALALRVVGHLVVHLVVHLVDLFLHRVNGERVHHVVVGLRIVVDHLVRLAVHIHEEVDHLHGLGGAGRVDHVALEAVVHRLLSERETARLDTAVPWALCLLRVLARLHHLVNGHRWDDGERDDHCGRERARREDGGGDGQWVREPGRVCSAQRRADEERGGA